MASPRKSGEERSISRTYRAAIRLGEDFITLEETITLPLDASDDEVAQAVDLGWRIYKAQRAAAEQQAADIREHAPVPPAITIRDPESPASDKQRSYIATLQDQMGWSGEQLGGYATEQQVDLVTLTKGQASSFIDGLKKVAEERASYAAAPAAPPAATPDPAARAVAGSSGPIAERQITALTRLAQQHGMDLDAESTRRYGVEARNLNYDQAAALLRELQPRRA